MRFDSRAVSLATYFAILLFNVYTFGLYFSQQNPSRQYSE